MTLYSYYIEEEKEITEEKEEEDEEGMEVQEKDLRIIINN